MANSFWLVLIGLFLLLNTYRPIPSGPHCDQSLLTFKFQLSSFFSIENFGKYPRILGRRHFDTQMPTMFVFHHVCFSPCLFFTHCTFITTETIKLSIKISTPHGNKLLSTTIHSHLSIYIHEDLLIQTCNALRWNSF